MASDSKKQDKRSPKGPTPEEVLNGFQTLRAEQRNLSSKLSEFELDLNEHKMVIETLKNVNEDRKCFRLVGGVLTERKVKDVLPVLISNQDKLKEFIEKLNEQITKKGQEINEYREKYNIRFRGLDNPKEEEKQVSSETRGNVLVSMVIETLKNVNEDRKCFRLVGGVLTERKVKDVLPVLISNQDKLKEFIEKLNEQITKKGQEINEYREKYNIRFRGLDNPKEEEKQVSSETRGNVLVS